MKEIFLAVVCTAMVGGIIKVILDHIQNERDEFIDQYPFPKFIPHKLRMKYPHLTDENLAQVDIGLRMYFQICRRAGRRFVSMPSQVVDVAWHEFILSTQEYTKFCKRALGRFLHHMPAEAMSTLTLAQDGIKRAWRLSCFLQNIDPKSPARLPLLFAIDTELAIPDGFKYSLDCKKPGAQGYCASSIGCSSGCGAGCGGGSSGDGGCGGGCGGD
jgi:hypothetical protein